MMHDNRVDDNVLVQEAGCVAEQPAVEMCDYLPIHKAWVRRGPSVPLAGIQ